MSNNPYLTYEDCQHLKDAGRYYLDYLSSEGIRRDDPKQYEKARIAYLHMCDIVQFWAQHPYSWDAIELKAPVNSIPRDILRK